jgi:hypothetical protein
LDQVHQLRGPAVQSAMKHTSPAATALPSHCCPTHFSSSSCGVSTGLGPGAGAIRPVTGSARVR